MVSIRVPFFMVLCMVAIPMQGMEQEKTAKAEIIVGNIHRSIKQLCDDFTAQKEPVPETPPSPKLPRRSVKDRIRLEQEAAEITANIKQNLQQLFGFRSQREEASETPPSPKLPRHRVKDHRMGQSEIAYRIGIWPQQKLPNHLVERLKRAEEAL